MKKTIGIILFFFLGFFSYAQGQLLKTGSQSFVMNCYQKKYSADTAFLKKDFDHLRDYRRCISCREEYENSKIVQKVFIAQLTQEPGNIYMTRKFGPDYYRYYSGLISRKPYSRLLEFIIDGL